LPDHQCINNTKRRQKSKANEWREVGQKPSRLQVTQVGRISEENPFSRLMREKIKQNALKKGDLLDFLAH